MKKLAIILLGLVLIKNSIAQNTLDKIGLSAASPAAAAFSLRLLSTPYAAGAAIQVRRSSDNAVMDIGFITGGNLDTISLKAFATTNSCYVTTWYDQSGNGMNATQVSAGNQPLIVNAGIVERQNGAPYMTFSGSQWLTLSMDFVRLTYPNAVVNMVYQSSSLTGSQALWGCDDGGWDRFQLLNFAASPSIAFGLSNGGSTTPNATNNTSRNIYTAVMNYGTTNGTNVYVNGIAGTPFTETGSGTTGNLTIGAIGNYGGYPLVGNASEYLLFTTSLAGADRQMIETNQAVFYNVDVPVITLDPSIAVQKICMNGTVAALSVTATATGPLTYQWYSNSINSNVGGSLISGATNSIYTPPTSSAATQYYYVLVTSSGMYAVTSNVSGAIIVDALPVVSISYTNTIHTGTSTTLTASGASSYLWGNIAVTPLDYVSSCQMAVGLRLLRTAYAGSALRLRRSSDNAEADFGFIGTELDTIAIKTFLGVANGYCKILYDQSGVGNNFVQANASQQPLLVLSGLNGKPVLHFTTSQTMNNTTNFPSPFSVIYTARQTGPSRGRVLTGVNNNWLLGWWNGSYGQAYYNGWVSSSGGNAANSNPYVYTATGTGGSSFIYQNDTLLFNNGGGVNGPNGISINGNEASDADVAELFIFSTVLANVDRSLVDKSSAEYYGIIGATSIPGAAITVSPTATTTYNVTGYSANGGCAVVASATVTVLNNPNIGAFSNLAKTLFDVSYVIAAPTTLSPAAFTYTSSNTSVATISGNTINIIAPGITTIKAVQVAGGGYFSDSVTATLTVSSVSVVTKNGQVTTVNPGYVNANGAIGANSGVSLNGVNKITLSQADGLTQANASTSAYAIKQAFPSSANGYYWIKNPNINGGAAFQIYADMTTDGGGWTLIMCNKAPNPGWSNAQAILRNATSPSISSNYSIIAWADYIKKSSSGFQYMIDANTRNSYGGIWTANSNYSFVSTTNANTNITLNTKFGSWNYADDGIEARMPWYAPGSQGLITTSNDANGNWWGTLIAAGGWTPAPWLGCCGMGDPGVIWYWVR